MPLAGCPAQHQTNSADSRCLEYAKGTIFIYGDHSLAAYWNAAEPVGYGSVPVGDIDPWDNGYGRGFYEALHDGRPEIFAGSA
jgi:hypothetical protein